MSRFCTVLMAYFFAVMFSMGSTLAAAAEKVQDRKVFVVAHRGLAPGYPENTLPAFRHALMIGVDYIEVDLRMTKDGIPVIMHDDTVDRTTDGHGDVGTFTLSDIKKLDAGVRMGPEFAETQVPTLEETLALITSLKGKLLLDIKSSSDLDCEKVVRLIERHNAVKDVIVGARSVEDVKRFRSLNADIRILGFIPGIRDIKKFVAADADFIRLWLRWIRAYPPIMKQARQYKKPVWITSGPAGRDELAELIELGANGILTDLPEVLMLLLSEGRKQHPGN